VSSKDRLTEVLVIIIFCAGLKWKHLLVFLKVSATRNMGSLGNPFIIHKWRVLLGGFQQASSLDLTNRLGTISSSPSDDILSKAEPATRPLLVLDHGPTKITGEELYDSARPETSLCASSCTELPAIPSFSEFVSSSRKAKDNRSKRDPEELEKRMRLQ
jgi:bloom syndrome protein